MKIKPYQLKNGETRYKVQGCLGYDPETGDRVQVTKQGFKTKKEARSAYKKLELEFDQGLHKKAKPKKIIYQDVFDTWIKIYETKVKESTLNSTIRIFHNHILPVFKNKPIDKIKPIHCQNYVQTLAGYVKGAQIFRYAAAPMDYAYKTDMIDSNPFEKVIMPKFKSPTVKDDFLRPEEVKKLMSVIDDLEHYVYFRLLIYTGMRKSEALALTWKDIDFKKRTILVDETLAHGLNYRLITHDPKSNKSHREMVVDVETLKALQELKKFTGSFLVFSNEKHKSYQPGRPNEWLNKYLDKAGLRHVTVHDLRRTHASLLFASGADMKEVQDRLGHEDIQVTMNIYTQVTEKNKEKAVDNFVRYLESS